MADLVGGHYPQAFGLQAVPFGNATNIAQSNVPPRSNLEYLSAGYLVDGAIAATGIQFAVPVAVDIGTTISAVTMYVGATAASLPTHSFAALYSGASGSTPALLVQSTDGGTAPIAASAAFKFTLTTPQNITAANAPFGWIWASICVVATTVNTAIVSDSTPSGVQYAWNAGSPPFLSCTTGSSLTTAASAIFAGSAKTVAPIVTLT
jgi:hypothetical protein